MTGNCGHTEQPHVVDSVSAEDVNCRGLLKKANTWTTKQKQKTKQNTPNTHHHQQQKQTNNNNKKQNNKNNNMKQEWLRIAFLVKQDPNTEGSKERYL